jgi:autotransporter passenger strand-loop-strand repeat protein
MTTVISGETLIISGGTTSSGITVLSGGILDVLSGGAVVSTIDSGGVDNISSGATATGTTVSSGGSEYVFAGGTAISTTVDSGGTEYLGSSNAFPGGTTISVTVNSGGALWLDGGFVSSGSINSGAIMDVLMGSYSHVTNDGTIDFGGNNHAYT